MNDLAARLRDALGEKYHLERELPLGGLGRLFLARTRTGEQVVVQALPPDIVSRIDAERFRQAIGRVARLKHSSLVPILEAGGSDDLLYVVSARPRGESLRGRLVREGGLSSEETMQVLWDVADALAYAHEEGVCHGDIRADTIYLDNGRGRIAEVGLRCALNMALEGTHAVDVRADLHALAVVGQQMLGGQSAPVEAVLARALSIAPEEQFASAAAFRDAVGIPPSRRRRRARQKVLAVGLVAVVAAAVLFEEARQDPPLDSDLLAIAPFEILVPEHDYWREGLVDVLAANLDGAGPLRTVPATVAVRHWEGRADRASALELGRRTGARLVLVGRVVGRGGDSVALVGTLLDIEGAHTLAELEVTDPEARLDRLADAVTVRLLNELSRSRPIGAVRRAMFGTTSLPALKAYLIGEQHFRRSEWDSAIASYQRAISLDSTFALPYYRAGIVLGWQTASGDSLSQVYLRRAAAHNRGLPPRDSLLVLAESLGTAVDEGYVANPLYWSQLRRLYDVVREATRRFPRDPEVWYEYGEVQYHYPDMATRRAMIDAFDRALRLDSAYAPAYIHAIELALQLGEMDRARSYIRRYLALGPRDAYADGIRLTEMLLDPSRRYSPSVQRILDTASADLLTAALANFRAWADSSETGIRLARLLAEGRPSAASLYSDSSFYIPELASNLAYHGRLAEAYALVGAESTWLYAILAHLGGIPAESAAVRFGASLRSGSLWPPNLAGLGVTIWANHGDTASLSRLAAAAEALRGNRHPLAARYGRYLAGASRAFIQLARGDTAGAARALLALPDTACMRCMLVRLKRAELLEAARMDEEAARVLSRDPPGFQLPIEPLWMLYRARVLDRRGESQRAAAAYRYVRDAWLHSDPVLQPFVREAGERLRVLGRRR